jgi:hypothetical protein
LMAGEAILYRQIVERGMGRAPFMRLLQNG